MLVKLIFFIFLRGRLPLTVVNWGSIPQLSGLSRSLRALREAGTLPRTARIKWGAGTPDAPLQAPSGTESMRMNAALAHVYASSSNAWRHCSHEEKWC